MGKDQERHPIIQVRRGSSQYLPDPLNAGEFGFTLDTHQLYISDGNKNCLIGEEIKNIVNFDEELDIYRNQVYNVTENFEIKESDIEKLFFITEKDVFITLKSLLIEEGARIGFVNMSDGVSCIFNNGRDNYQIVLLQYEYTVFTYIDERWIIINQPELGKDLYSIAENSFESGYVYGGAKGWNFPIQNCNQYCANVDTWMARLDMPAPARDELAASTILDKGYVYGGGTTYLYFLQDCDEYNSVTNIWTSKSDMLAPARKGFAASTINHKGYVYGGYVYEGEGRDRIQNCDEYNSVTNIWTAKSDMPAPVRDDLAASTILDKGYVYGGEEGGTLQDCDEYDPDTWTSKTDMPVPGRDRLAASTILDKGYVYGGNDFNDIKDCDEYDSNANTWSSKTDLLIELSDLAASTINDKGYIYGEIYCNEYDVDNDTWTAKSNMLTPSDSLAASTI